MLAEQRNVSRNLTILSAFHSKFQKLVVKICRSGKIENYKIVQLASIRNQRFDDFPFIFRHGRKIKFRITDKIKIIKISVSILVGNIHRSEYRI